MLGKKVLLILAVGAALILQFADCMGAVSQDHQAMQCCGTAKCTPANQSHNCCKTMNPPEAPRMLVKARASVDVPSVVAVEHTPALETAAVAPLNSLPFETQEYSPPDLYTLHSSLLI